MSRYVKTLNLSALISPRFHATGNPLFVAGCKDWDWKVAGCNCAKRTGESKIFWVSRQFGQTTWKQWGKQLNLQIKWRGMLVLDRVLDVSMNHASLVAWPNISFGLERTLFRYKGTFSPQLHAFRYEGRAACTSLCICHCKMKLHHVALTSEWHLYGFFACTPFLTETCILRVSGPLSLIQRIATFSQHVWHIVPQQWYPVLLQPVLSCMFFHDFWTWQALGYTASSLLVLALLFNVCNDW